MPALSSNIFDTALIFEGGGMRASYTAGVVVTLLEAGIYFDNVYGLSAGSSCAVNYVSRDPERAKKSFVDLVKDPEFGGLGTLLTGKGWFSAYHIYQETGKPDGFLPFDMETFLANPAKVTIESFQRDTGASVYWTKDDLSTLDELMLCVRASSTLPFVMPSPVVDGQHYYDGGMGEGAGFLLPRAQHDGFKRFFIVRTRPRTYRKSKSEGLTDKLTHLYFRKYPHLLRALDSRWQRYNVIADEIDRLAADGAAYVFYADEMAVSSGETDFAKLQNSYDTGYAQAQEELPAMKKFLGL